MSDTSEDARDWEGRVGAWLGARWKWLLAGVLLLFALNNLVGLVVGAVGMLLFANRIAGRLLGARRLAQQVQQIVRDPDDSTGEA